MFSVGTSVAIAFPLIIIAFYVTNIIEYYQQGVKWYQTRKARKARKKEEREDGNGTLSRASTLNFGQVSKTVVADGGNKPTFKSQLLSIRPWDKTRRGKAKSTKSPTPSDIEAGKQAVAKENPDKP
jgi:hypothetical protein